MDPEILPGFGITVPDPAKLKEKINKSFIYNFRPEDSGLYR